MDRGLKFQTENYNISIIGKHVQVTDAMKQYALEKLSKIDKFADHILDITVAMDKQKLTHSVSILMKFLHFKIKAQATSEDMYAAIDKATERLMKLVRKYKEKLISHRSRNVVSTDMKLRILSAEDEELAEINDEIEAENLKEEEELYKTRDIASKRTVPLKILKRDEALMKLELSSDPFLIFREEEDMKLKVIYRRDDKQFGLIEVE